MTVPSIDDYTSDDYTSEVFKRLNISLIHPISFNKKLFEIPRIQENPTRNPEIPPNFEGFPNPGNLVHAFLAFLTSYLGAIKQEFNFFTVVFN